MKVFVPTTISDVAVNYLIEREYDVVTGFGETQEELIEGLKDCDGALIRFGTVDRTILNAFPKLKVIARHGVGTDTLDLDVFREKGVVAINAPISNILSVAEHTMMLMLACAKQMAYKIEQYKLGNYAIKDKVMGNEISGKVLGLIGLGNIASQVARIAYAGFNMHILAYDPYLPLNVGLGETRVKLLRNRDDLLHEADFVSLHIPYTKENYHYISTKEFKVMKSSAILINTSRGPVVDSDAMHKALVTGQIAGAGLDVSEPEPAKPDDPLFALNNVILTPHCGGVTIEACQKVALDAARGVDDVLSGREPTWRVV